MRYLRKFEEVRLKYTKETDEKERIPISIFVSDIRESSSDFNEICEDDRPGHTEQNNIKWGISYYLTDVVGLGWKFPEGKEFKLEYAYKEKGDRKDESTYYGIFKRKSDGKFFKLWVHDAGQIGPSTLTLCEHLEEVSETQPKIIRRWD